MHEKISYIEMQYSVIYLIDINLKSGVTWNI